MLFTLFLLLLFQACGYQNASGIWPTERKGGPLVRYDLEAKPIPEIPMPNNVATRIDTSSPTGLRLNVSMIAPTSLEEDMRKKVNNLTGFGVYSPIWVSFSEPLDVDLIRSLHGDSDAGNDAVYLVNITRDSKEFGRVMPLDVGNGNFPIVLESVGEANLYFENDPRKDASNIIFETYDEDKNQNGELNEGEDSDMDGILDSPNVHPQGSGAVDGLLSFYEKETNTLIVRPLLPLLEETTYAVVLLKRLKGIDGNPVESPFPFVNHSNQTDKLELLFEIPNLPFKREDVAFAWVFTTASIMRELLAIRAGLYGYGSMSYLKDKYPVDRIKLDYASDPEGENPYILRIDPIISLIEQLPRMFGVSEKQKQMFIEDFKAIDYYILGSFRTPYFLADRDGIATPRYPADDDEVFDIDPISGKAVVGEDYVTFICAVPKAGKAGNPPFPVGFIGHGYTGNRLDAFFNAGRFARFGIAACGLDATGHGLPDIGKLDPEIEEVAKILGLTTFIESLQKGRARDLNNDGKVDSGGDYWTADIFHTRDVVRQTLVDYMQFIRILRSFDGKRKWSVTGKGLGELAGDFNGDGVVDIGGEGERYHATGGSLGGIISGALAGIEPALASAAPVAGGAGLVDIGVRSSQGGVPEAVFMPLLGPFISGNRLQDGKTEIKFLVNNVNSQGHYPFYYSEKISDGDVIVAKNLRSDESSEALVTGGKFRLGLAADALTATERRPLLGLKDDSPTEPVSRPKPFLFGDQIRIKVIDGVTGIEKEVIDKFGVDVIFQGVKYEAGTPLEAIAKGLGLKRNSPNLRRMLAIAAFVVEPADPVVFAPHYFKYPLEYPYDPGVKPGANVLVVPTTGDMNVPVNTGIAMARAAGTLSISKEAGKKICFDATDFGDAGKCASFKGCEVQQGCDSLEACLADGCRETPFCGNFQCCNGKRDHSAFYKDLSGKGEICLSENEVLIYFHALEAVERFRRFAFYPFCDCREVLFDADNLSDGTDGFDSPSLSKPLRASVKTDDGWQLMRIPYVHPSGSHGFGIPNMDKPFPIDNYMFNLIGYYIYTQGNLAVLHDKCFSDSSCQFFPWNNNAP